jgi:hypothetical protein
VEKKKKEINHSVKLSLMEAKKVESRMCSQETGKGAGKGMERLRITGVGEQVDRQEE